MSDPREFRVRLCIDGAQFSASGARGGPCWPWVGRGTPRAGRLAAGDNDLAKDANGVTVPNLSPDGTRIAVKIRDQEKRRWVWDTELRTLLPLKQPMSLAGN